MTVTTSDDGETVTVGCTLTVHEPETDTPLKPNSELVEAAKPMDCGAEAVPLASNVMT